ncbi:MAG: hypothetical protein JXA99_15405 [Candidatus Lokiarchaeota archaeon]|nr:hypothetical protein [Candidatus Lokiarchaeota archaeon]
MENIRRKSEEISDKFNNSDYVPDDSFCNAIDDNSLFSILKYTFDGRLCNFALKKDIDYLKFIRQTNNEFLKLAFFECLKNSKSDGEQKKILNSERLIPLYLNVAFNIIKQENQRYSPMWLIKEYINLAHKSNNPKILNQEMSDNVGSILLLIINNQNGIYNEDIFYILNEFLRLDKKILVNINISQEISNAIDYWINQIFYGNITYYDFEKELLNNIFNFFRKTNRLGGINSIKEIIFNKYKQFYSDEIDNDTLNLENIQSIRRYQLFTNYMIEITQIYCIDEEIKSNLIKKLKIKYEKLNKNIQIAIKKIPLITGNFSISVKEIEDELKSFKNDTIKQFLQKSISNDYFIPEIPNITKKDFGISSYLPTIIYDDIIKKYDGRDPIVIKTFNYEMNVIDSLTKLKHKLKDFKKYEFLEHIYAFIHSSDLIDDLTKKLFYLSLGYFVRKDYFLFIQTCIFQIEHTLRALCEKKNIPNLYKDEKKEVPKGIEYMIGELKKENLLNEKLLFLIGWLFSGEETIIPKNIRNKIAHGIKDLNDFIIIYTEENSLLIILIYLSLSKF